MLFHSGQFLLFLGITFGLYWWVHRHTVARLAVLLVASLVFYSAWTPFPLLVFLWCATVDHVCIALFRRLKNPGHRKAVLIGSLVSNLGILSIFKYGDLFYKTSAAILGQVGIQVRYEPMGLLLPLGLSFVVFQAVSLTVDAYRGQINYRFTFPEHLLYLLFFPQVVSGPIVRASDLLARFRERPTLTPDEGAHALFRIATGMAKKLLIADVLASQLIDRVFEQPSLYTSAECAVAAVAYTFQLYFDFSGYSDIAIGVAALFGFKYPSNFDKPYLAKNLFEFWNRWHISLSTWLRDYLYRPLGGNRVSRPRALFNLMTVMVLGGLWHGADWRFALWGAAHGLMLCAIRIVWWWRGKPEFYTPFQSVVGILMTMTIVVLTRVVFRAPDISAAGDMYLRILELTPGLANVSLLVWVTLLGAIVLHAMPHRVFQRTSDLYALMPVPARAACLVFLALLANQVAQFEVRAYIYFQF